MIACVSAKLRKPPIDKKSIRERLELALREQFPVRVFRWIPDAYAPQGFVVGLGTKWVAIAWLSDALVQEGWELVRLKDIQSVKLERDEAPIEIRVLKARQAWPPPALDVSLDGIRPLLDSIRLKSKVVGIHLEFGDSSFWIGDVVDVSDSTFRLRILTTSAEWKSKLRTFDSDDVTRVTIGDAYLTSLYLVAGEPPPENV
jgi:hypothetical protein